MVGRYLSAAVLPIVLMLSLSTTLPMPVSFSARPAEYAGGARPQQVKSLNYTEVTGSEVWANEVVVMNGNLVIKPGGSLTLVNTTVIMNCTYELEYEIEVKQGGLLNVTDGSNITTSSPDYPSLIECYGTLSMHDSSVSRMGIYIDSVEGASIENCTISEGMGIIVELSKNVVISGSRIVDNRLFEEEEASGIILSSSINVTVEGNRVANNTLGLWMFGCVNVTVRNNEFWRNGMIVWADCEYFRTYVVENNTVNGKPLLYLFNSTGTTVSGDYGQVVIACSRDISVEGLNLSRTDVGLEVVLSSNINITECLFQENLAGIMGSGLENLTITMCDVIDNLAVGIYLSYCWFTTVLNSTITGNGASSVEEGSGGMYIQSGNATIHYCSIYSNPGFGLYASWTTVNATYNWWGSDEGPELTDTADPEDPEEICIVGESTVYYEPYLTSMPILDEEPPTLTIKSPSPGALLSGNVTVSVDASDPSGVAYILFYVDDTLVLNDTKAPYEYVWDTTGWDDGNHTIRVVAVDTFGNAAEASITVTVDNTAPSVSITEPSGGEAVRGTLTVRADASDASGVESVKFYINGMLVYTDVEAPYEYVWNTTEWDDGDYTIKVVAVDVLGNEGEDTVTPVTVDNTQPTVGAPAISPSEPKAGEDVDVTVWVMDETSGLAEVKLMYSTDGGSHWTEVAMTKSGENYTATIPGQPAGTEVLYMVEARDRAGNTATSTQYSYTVKSRVALTKTTIYAVGAAVAVAVAVALLFALKKRP